MHTFLSGAAVEEELLVQYIGTDKSECGRRNREIKELCKVQTSE